MIEVGRVGRPHGLDGTFHVARAEAGLLPDRGESVTVGDVAYVVSRRGGTAQRPTLKLQGVDGRAALEALRGGELLVERSDDALDDDEWWADDLVGLAVRDGEVEVGVVDSVLAYPSCEVLVVGERLIPLIDDAVRTVDVEAGVVDVDLAFLGEA